MNLEELDLAFPKQALVRKAFADCSTFRIELAAALEEHQSAVVLLKQAKAALHQSQTLLQRAEHELVSWTGGPLSERNALTGDVQDAKRALAKAVDVVGAQQMRTQALDSRVKNVQGRLSKVQKQQEALVEAYLDWKKARARQRERNDDEQVHEVVGAMFSRDKHGNDRST